MKLPQYAYSAEITIDGTSMRASAPVGTCRRSETFAAHSGRIRSKAAAKITRVDERKSVPAHPMNQAPNARMKSAWNAALWMKKLASSGGYGKIGIVGWAVPPYSGNQ